MMKRKPLGLILALTIIMLTVPPVVSQPYWTVMIYMDGDNNLEAAAIDDLNELESAGSDANINIVVQIDRIPGYNASNGDWTSTRRYYVTPDPNGYDGIIVSTLIADLGELDMGSPTTLINFTNWARTNYPADYYLLVLWDHGDGWKNRMQIATKGKYTRVQKREPLKGICHDDTDGSYLDMSDLRTALNTITSGGTVPIDIIGMDACLMAMLEVDYEVFPYCSYRVGSEESEPFDGWDYEATMGWLVANPTSTPAQLASQIATDYMNFYGFLGSETQSAVDLSQTSALAVAVNTLAVDLTNNVASYFYDLQDIRDQVEEYSDADFTDLYHFAQLVQTTISDLQIQTDAQNVMNAITAAVIAEGHGIGNPNSHGISIYFPYGYCSYLSRYESDTMFAMNTAWDEFLNAYYSTAPTPLHAIALIDDDASGCGNLTPVEDYYEEILDNMGILYDYYNAEIHGTPSLSYLQVHSTVIWFTGSDFSTTLSPAEESVLIQYLNGGGKLFLSSQDYVWDLKNDGRYPSVFLRDYLHTVNVGEDTGVNTLSGVVGNDVGDGLGPYEMCWISETCGLMDYADWIEKDAESEYAFYNENSEYVALTYDGAHDVVWFAFRYEGITLASARQQIMERILDFLDPAILGSLADLFSTNTFFVAGDQAYCTDVLGSARIAFALATAGTAENPEGRTDVTLTQTEHDTGNLIPVGGPSINPVADEFDNYFNITYTLQAGVSFEIFADSESIFLDLTLYPIQDIAIIFVGRHNYRNILLVWGYGWQGTYAASVFLGDITNWDAYAGARMIMLRWTDSNVDGLVQDTEITVVAYT